MNKLQQNQPCKGEIHCPFRKTCLKGWLGKAAATNIVDSPSFVCHKDKTTQCAGHMLVSKNNKTVMLARMLKLPPLSGQDEVFQSEQEFIDHHSKNDQS